MAQKLLAANWKENPKTKAQAIRLFKDVAKIKRGKNVQAVICPPFIYLEHIADVFKKMPAKSRLALGAQDVFWEEKGPFTSEVGPRMIRSLGAHYAIIGHSERRKWLHETDAMINKKVKSALADGLHVILCVGESIVVRKKGVLAAERFVRSQLTKDLVGIDRTKQNARRIIIAYEPIWAIGTGRYDTPGDAMRMAIFIKNILKRMGQKSAKVLYGGSVNSKNVADYVTLKEIDGALVGGASLKAGEFKKMISIVTKL